MEKEDLRKNRIILLVIIVGIILAIVIIFSTNSSKTSGAATTNQGGSVQEVKRLPLTVEEQQKVAQTILSTEFIKDVPENDPIALTFFSFEGGQRVWRDSFLIGRDQLLSEGTPSIHLTLHSKYIERFNGDNLCELVREANKNGDLGFETEHGKASLLIKYAGMLKHRDCFGF